MLYLKQYNPSRGAILFTHVSSVAAAIKQCRFISTATLHIVPDELSGDADKVVTFINKQKGKSVEKLLTTMLIALSKGN